MSDRLTTETTTRRTRRTPEERAAAILSEAKARGEKRIRAQAGMMLERAHRTLLEAAAHVGAVDAECAQAVRVVAEMVDGLELGA